MSIFENHSVNVGVFEKYCVCLMIRNNNVMSIAYLPHTAHTCIRVVARLPPYVYLQSMNIIHTHFYKCVCMLCLRIFTYMYVVEGVTEGLAAGVLYKYARLRSEKNTI